MIDLVLELLSNLWVCNGLDCYVLGDPRVGTPVTYVGSRAGIS